MVGQEADVLAFNSSGKEKYKKRKITIKKGYPSEEELFAIDMNHGLPLHKAFDSCSDWKKLCGL